MGRDQGKKRDNSASQKKFLFYNTDNKIMN